MKIAIGSTDGQKVDLHFGKAPHFFVYEIQDGVALAEGPRPVPTYAPAEGVAHGDILQRFDALFRHLADCQRIYVSRIGEFPNKQLRQRGVDTQETDASIHEILTQITGGSQ